MSGSIVTICIAGEAGIALVAHSSATLEAGKGIAGDRYYQRTGTFSEKLKDRGDWEVTLIELEEIDRFNTARGHALDQTSFRRNIVTSGVRLNDLVGRQFRVGDAVLEGVRLCEPCAYLAKLLDPGIVQAMAHRAGLRARIISGAVIRAGDSVTESGTARHQAEDE